MLSEPKCSPEHLGLHLGQATFRGRTDVTQISLVYRSYSTVPWAKIVGIWRFMNNTIDWLNNALGSNWRSKVPDLPMIIERCILHTSSLPFIRRKLNTRLMYNLVPRCIDDQTRLWSCKVCHDTHWWYDVLIRYIVQELDVEVVDVVVIEQEGLVVKLNSVANTKTFIMSEFTGLDSKCKITEKKNS